MFEFSKLKPENQILVNYMESAVNTLMKAERCQNFVIKIINDSYHKKYDSITLLRNALDMLKF